MSTLSETVLVFVGLFGGAILGLGIGIIYFVKTQRDARLWVRALASSFGPSLALIFAVASLWWPEQYRYQPKGVHAFYWLQVVPMLLLSFTLARYPGPRRLHWILLPAGLLAWLWTFVLGWLFVHGRVGAWNFKPDPGCGLTLPSRGCPKGCAFCAPLMSNVRPHKHYLRSYTCRDRFS